MKTVFTPQIALAKPIRTPKLSFYELLGPVRKLRTKLGLTPNDLAVLTALISFLPREGGPGNADIEPGMMVVFPSNAKLAERANDVDERTLRRCLSRLTNAGLITRKNSANGKRFPLRYNGKIRDAFGFDLRPLFDRHDSLIKQASQADQEREKLRSLRAEALALRASVMERPDLAADDLVNVTAMRNILRRATLTAKVLLEVIGQLRAMAANGPASFGERTARATQNCADPSALAEIGLEPLQMTASNGQNVRHIESTKIDLNRTNGNEDIQSGCANRTSNALKRDPSKMAWDDFKNVAGFFPKPPQSPSELKSIVIEMGRFLKIQQDQLFRSVERLGIGKVLLLIDYLLERAEDIVNPGAYLQRVMANTMHSYAHGTCK